MFTAALDGLVDRFGLDGEQLGAVIGGAVLKHSRDFNLTRESVLGTALSARTPAFDLQQACGTGLQAAVSAADGIAAGRYEVAAAGGVDTTSDPRSAWVTTCAARCWRCAGRNPTWRGSNWWADCRPPWVWKSRPTANRAPVCRWVSMLRSPRKMGIKRVDQDRLAAASHRNMAAAYDRGFFDDLITPFLGLYRDNNLRADSTEEKLAGLRPVFGVKGGDATMTAGNSTPLTDGASVALLSSEDWAQTRGLEPLAYFTDAETAAVDYVSRADGLLMAPTYAVPRLLARNGLGLQDFDFYEIHEAFASVVLMSSAGLGIRAVLQGTAGTGCSAGRDRPCQAQRQRLPRWRRGTVRGDRRPDRGAAGQTTGREEGRDRPGRSRADLDLCRGWSGRHRDPGGLIRPAVRWFERRADGVNRCPDGSASPSDPRPGGDAERRPESSRGRMAAAGAEGLQRRPFVVFRSRSVHLFRRHLFRCCQRQAGLHQSGVDIALHRPGLENPVWAAAVPADVRPAPVFPELHDLLAGMHDPVGDPGVDEPPLGGNLRLQRQR